MAQQNVYLYTDIDTIKVGTFAESVDLGTGTLGAHRRPETSLDWWNYPARCEPHNILTS